MRSQEVDAVSPTALARAELARWQEHFHFACSCTPREIRFDGGARCARCDRRITVSEPKKR